MGKGALARAGDGAAPTRFREAISRFATGVTVITTRRPDGPAGMTANAVSSLSLSPLLLLVCISNRLPTHEALLESRCFAVNVLGQGDEDLALRFARPSEDKFENVDVDYSSGLPVLRRAIAHFVCEVREALPGGDHSIFIGEVRHCDFIPHRRPLVYFGSKFSAIHPGDTALVEACAWDAASRM
jgi:flavin reductase (DIM6/NTAB) family NADH-FMN oxidoreductase RutF